MYSCVWASTPTVTRTSTGATTPSSAATVGDAVDLVEGVDDDPADPVVERRARSRRRSCCCRASRSAPPGTPARSATASSPPVQTSRRRPSSRHPARDRGAQERLARVVDVGAAAQVGEGLGEASPERRAPGRGSRPRRGRRPACRTRAASSRDVDARRPSARRRRRGRRCAAHSGGTSALTSPRRPQPATGRGSPRRAGRRPRGAQHYIRSGARDPEQVEAVGEHLTRVASLSQSRVRCRSVTSSSPLSGRTRQVVVPLVVRGRRGPRGSARPGAARAARPPAPPRAGSRRGSPSSAASVSCGQQRRVEAVLGAHAVLHARSRRTLQVRAWAYCT